jgi:HNH endonuclease
VPIRVYKVADILAGEVMFCGTRRFREGDLAAILTNMSPPADPIPESAWKLNLTIGEGAGAHDIKYPLPPLLSRSSYSEATPTFIDNENRFTHLVYFRDRLFMSERRAIRDSERVEVVLRIKKAIYDEEAELSNLRAAVANLEAAIEFEKSGPKRDPIPEDVKLLVWARDGGCCVRCGSKQGLHFDHIIPIAKGGGNSEANIQVLCQTCNLKKSDRIAML